MTTTWKYTDATQLVVYRTLTNGSMQSCSVEATNYLKWVADGNTATAADAIPDPTYQENRVKEYPPIGDQLDDIYHNGLTKWKATIKVIKDKYPKE